MVLMNSHDSHINGSKYINESYEYWWLMIVKDYCIGNISDNCNYDTYDSHDNDNDNDSDNDYDS